ncbi:MAG TPA: VOC family protein [Candidatus Acidoferrales bacterium]|nr:VOC family protein [Candidatus Acidoferrales bacterium]
MRSTARSASRRRRKSARTATDSGAANVPPVEVQPVRGVKLKHVSTITMILAFLCLFAYLAGRVDVSAATSTAGYVQSAGKEHAMFLGLRTAKYEVQDMAKAKEWYSKALGMEPYFDQPAFYVGYNVGGYDLGLVPAPKAETKRAAAGVAYWGVEDAHAAYKRLIELGATPVEDVQDVGGGMLVGEVRDPFGNVLGIIYNPQFKPGETK